MSEKFKGKYRSESARLKNWDYGSEGAYFITICTKDREHYFGEIKNGKMHVSPAGAIAHVLWHEIMHHTKNVTLGEFVVMPNHIHGILIIDGIDPVFGGRAVACNGPTTENRNGPTIGKTNTTTPNQSMAAISPKPNSVSTIIRSYKSAVTKHCNRLGLAMAWQPRFHDHIIRDDTAYQRISEYIKNNPAKWKEDIFHQNMLTD